MSRHGIEASSGSACSSQKEEVSHVLKACGIPEAYRRGGIRITLGRYNTWNDVRHFLAVLPKILEKLRNKIHSENVFMSMDEFQEKISAGKNIQILDIRFGVKPGREVSGSIYLPFWKVRANIFKLDRDKETAVICHHGIISPFIRQVLSKNGFKNVKALEGGYVNYAKYMLS